MLLMENAVAKLMSSSLLYQNEQKEKWKSKIFLSYTNIILYKSKSGKSPIINIKIHQKDMA